MYYLMTELGKYFIHKIEIHFVILFHRTYLAQSLLRMPSLKIFLLWISLAIGKNQVQKVQGNHLPPQPGGIFLQWAFHTSKGHRRNLRIFHKYVANVYHVPTNTIRSSLVKPKDPAEPEDQCDVIYKIDCKDCGEIYI